jgi:hypothetical protein
MTRVNKNTLSRCLTLNLLGTRVFPRPNPQDIIMDLAARAAPFAGGVAHEGMVTGTRLDIIMDPTA